MSIAPAELASDLKNVLPEVGWKIEKFKSEINELRISRLQTTIPRIEELQQNLGELLPRGVNAPWSTLHSSGVTETLTDAIKMHGAMDEHGRLVFPALWGRSTHYQDTFLTIYPATSQKPHRLGMYMMNPPRGMGVELDIPLNEDARTLSFLRPGYRLAGGMNGFGHYVSGPKNPNFQNDPASLILATKFAAALARDALQSELDERLAAEL